MRLFENSELLSAHFRNGMMMLPYYHYIIVSKLNEQDFYGLRKERLSRIGRIKNFFKGLKHFTLRKSKMIIFSSTVLEIEKDGHFFNRLYGYYFNMYKDSSLLIEDSLDDYVWRTGSSHIHLSFVNTYLVTFADLLSRLLKKIHPLQSADYQKFIVAYPDIFSEEKLSMDDYFISIYAFMLKICLKLVGPKVVMVDDGSYGGVRAIVCYVAKQMGIKVIEAQHGFIYNSHIAYNVSEIVYNSSEYKEYLPDVFFAFGDYWLNFVKWDYEKVTVGNPYLNEYLLSSKVSNITYDFLVISQPLEEIFAGFNKSQFIKDLSCAFPESRILFRLHPAEHIEDQKEIYHEYKNIDVVSSSSVLYEDFNKCQYIVGWYSTCLIEALSFNKIPIIIDSEITREFFPHEIGVWVKTPYDLKNMDLHLLNKSSESSYFFAAGFEENVRKYLDKIL